MKATERKFRDLVREHRESISGPPGAINVRLQCLPVLISPAALTAEIRRELDALDHQGTMMKPDDEIARQALARIVALVIEADIEWYR